MPIPFAGDSSSVDAAGCSVSAKRFRRKIVSMTQKPSQKVPRPASRPRDRGVSTRPRIEEHALESRLKRFDPGLHGGEVMAWRPVGSRCCDDHARGAPRCTGPGPCKHADCRPRTNTSISGGRAAVVEGAMTHDQAIRASADRAHGLNESELRGFSKT